MADDIDLARDGDEQPPEDHGNEAHTENFAEDGTPQPPEDHDNAAHTEDFITSDDVDTDGLADDPHGNEAHTDNFAQDGDPQPPEDHGSGAHSGTIGSVSQISGDIVNSVNGNTGSVSVPEPDLAWEQDFSVRVENPFILRVEWDVDTSAKAYRLNVEITDDVGFNDTVLFDRLLYQDAGANNSASLNDEFGYVDSNGFTTDSDGIPMLRDDSEAGTEFTICFPAAHLSISGSQPVGVPVSTTNAAQLSSLHSLYVRGDNVDTDGNRVYVKSADFDELPEDPNLELYKLVEQ